MTLEEMDVPQRLDNHEERIKSLEDYRIQQERLNGEISKKLSETEVTVLKESGKQQEMTKQLLDHVLKSKSFAQQEFWKLAGIVLGSGGILYFLVETLANK